MSTSTRPIGTIHLVAAELAINNSKQASTGFTPFYLNNGREVSVPLDLALEEARTIRQPNAAERITRLHRDLELAKEHLLKAQQRQAHHADRHRREVIFKVGDEVLLSTAHLKMIGNGDRAAKFAYKYIGPFKIKRVVNNNAYELELPPQLEIHPVLNISRLKAYHDGRLAFPLRTRVDSRPPPAVTSTDGDEYEVESILAKRGSGARTEYLVRWRGWPTWEATWERRSSLQGASDAVDTFENALQAANMLEFDENLESTWSLNTLIEEVEEKSSPIDIQSTPPPVPASCQHTPRSVRPTSARRSGPMQSSPAQGCAMQLPRARPDHTGSRRLDEDLQVVRKKSNEALLFLSCCKSSVTHQLVRAHASREYAGGTIGVRVICRHKQP